MSSRGFNLAGNRQFVLVGLGLLALVAVVAVLLVAVSPFGTRVAHGSGTGPGGCVATTGPSCHFSGNEATAIFDSIASDGCTATEAFIQPMASVTRPGGVTSQSVFISIDTFDICQGIGLGSASNLDPNTFLPDFTGTVQFDGKLSTASVVGTAPMFDGFTNAQLFTTTINLTWHGYGSTSQSIDSSHFHGFGFIDSTHFNGQSRSAEASGTLTDATGTNLATPATLGAQLDNATSGTVFISKS
jgi:hypothetical protein